jgi:trehalose 6-phosphate phosphatase
VVSDFDGTLSPIVMDPWGAAVLPAAQRALRRLAGATSVHVAILSGRTASDVAARTRIGGASYLGNHGVERGRLGRRQRAGSMAIEVVAVADRYAEAAERIATRLPQLIPDPWLVVERKAPAVSLHFRSAPDVAAAAELVAEAVDRLDPGRELVRFPGRRVLELRPPGVPAKGEAMESLLEEHQPAVALMLGDDVSDAEAFVALTSARAAGRLDGLAIAVQARTETPPAVTAAADLVLASPAEAARFLSGLARRLTPS